LITSVSQGSAATHFRCGGFVSLQF